LQTPAVEPGKKELSFERVDPIKAPQEVRAVAERSRSRETASLIEESGEFWILITRGEKPTGGYGVRVEEALLETMKDGSRQLTVSYRHIDPAKGQFVTQALTYPVELVRLKGIKEKPDNVNFKAGFE